MRSMTRVRRSPYPIAAAWAATAVLAAIADEPVDQPRVDCVPESPWVCGQGPVGSIIRSSFTPELLGELPVERLDFLERTRSDFSHPFTITDRERDGAIGFVPGPSAAAWNLAPRWSAAFDLRIDQPAAFPRDDKVTFRISLVDATGHRLTSNFHASQAQGQWASFVIAIKEMKGSEEFDFAQVVALQCEPDVVPGAVVRFDDVRFLSDNGQILGVTDKSVSQRISEAASTCAARARSAMSRSAARQQPRVKQPWMFARFFVADDLHAANSELFEVLSTDDAAMKRSYGLEDHWDLQCTPWLYRLWFNFSSHSGRPTAGRLTAANERLILKRLWERTFARTSTTTATTRR
ncbi:hypothetical protein OAS39_01405 [Pirellulales bacterium]|nr:hypothetical protein [Pirellulales bacterium]